MNTFKHRRFNLALAATAVAALLSACGGGASSTITGSIGSSTPSASATDLTVVAGDSVAVAGVMTSNTNLLKSMSWTASGNVGPTALVLTNNNCANVSKIDKPKAPSDSLNGSTGSSTWTCELGVTTPVQSVANAPDQYYTLTLTATDDIGKSSTSVKTLRVTSDPNFLGNVVNAGNAISVTTGDTAPLHCGTTDANAKSYQWVIDNANGLPISLSSYNTADSSFTAPSVKDATPVNLTCRVTDKFNKVTTGSVVVTVKPPPLPTLVAKITGTTIVSPGQRIALTGNGTWYDTKNVVTTGPAVTYSWTPGSTAPSDLIVTNLTGSTTTLLIPQSIKTFTYFPVTVTATAGNVTSSDTVTILVDPNGGLTPTVSPAAQSVKSGAAVSIATNLGATVTSPVYYQWTVVSGPTISLGAANTGTVGFVAPSVGAATEFKLRVAIGYSPITVSNPGAYFVDAVVNVAP